MSERHIIPHDPSIARTLATVVSRRDIGQKLELGGMFWSHGDPHGRHSCMEDGTPGRPQHLDSEDRPEQALKAQGSAGRR